MKKTNELDVRGTLVRVIKIGGKDYVCLTDMAKLKSRVIVDDFTDVMVDEFAKRKIKLHNVTSELSDKSKGYVITYDARQSWDCSLYLSDATIRIIKDGMPVAKGKYHHIGQSFSLDIFTKWRGTEWKMKDLYDELLKNYPIHD